MALGRRPDQHLPYGADLLARGRDRAPRRRSAGACPRGGARGDQRFVQSLKTHLASRAFSETRLYGQRFTIEHLIGTFLRDLAGGDLPPCRLTAGRPVVFAGAAADEALAITRLNAAYAAAGTVCR